MISSLELAKLCGVSQGTVDRALHDRPGINPKTKDRILEAARKHGYRPHAAARELLTGERRTIGAIAPSLTNRFYMDLIGAIRNELVADGLRLFISPCSDEEECRDLLADFASRRCRAVIIVPPHEIDLPPTESFGMKIVSLIRPCHGKGITFLTPPEHLTGRNAVRYLAALGHLRIMHLTYPADSWAINLRSKSFTQSAEKHKIQHTTCVFESEEHVIEAFEKFKPTAIFCHNDLIALRFMHIARRLNVSIPEDVSLLGVDNCTEQADLYALSTMTYPLKSVAQAVHAVINDRKPNKIDQITVFERKTTAPPA